MFSLAILNPYMIMFIKKIFRISEITPAGFINAALAALIIFVFSSCSGHDGNYSISGTLDNAEGRKIYLYEMSTYELTPLDSFTFEYTGEFRFQGEIDQIRFMSLREDQLNNLVLVVSPGEDIEITADYNNLQESATIEGSSESKLAYELNREMHLTLMKLDSLSSDYRSRLNGSAGEFEQLRAETATRFNDIAEEHRHFTIDFINRNPSSLASLMALYHQIDANTFVLQHPEDFQYYIMVDSILTDLYPDLDYTVTLNENVKEMKSQFEQRQQRESLLATGSMAPEISLPDPDGETKNLSYLRGNYVLLDFWAAWCGPCREENPYLVDAYSKYNNNGFEIFQVSLDRTRDAWLRGIEEDNLHRWTHVSDLQFWSSEVVPLYQIDGIPANFLLDPDGKIIARNLRGEELNRTLAELFD